MKRTKLLLAGLLAALPLIGWAAVAHAQSFRSGNNITVAQNQVIDQALYATGRTIDIAGTVNGDVFCAGQNVTITGTVDGDVICAGQNVHISGKVTGDIRAAGQDVSISGSADHSLSAFGQNVTLESSSRIGIDVSIAGQDATLDGSVGRDLAAAANTVAINGTVGRNVRSADTQLALGSGAIISGNITYTSTNVLSRANGAQVSGTVTHKQSPQKQTQHAQYGAFIRGGLWFALYLFVVALIAAMVLALLLPQTFHAATQVAIEHPAKTVLTGLAASIAAPVIIVLLLFTVVGIPLGLLALLIWLVLLLLSGPFAAYYTGRLLMLKAHNALLIMLVGAVVLLVLYFVPFLGALVSVVAIWFGLGIILSHIGRLPKPRYAVTTIAGHNEKNPK